MRNLSEIVAELRRHQDIAKVCVDDYPANQRGAWGLKKRASQDAVERLDAEYVTALQAASVTVIPYGDDQAVESLVSAAEAEGVDLLVNAEKLYLDVARTLDKTLGRTREWTPTVLEYALREANNLAVDLGAKDTKFDAARAYRSRCLPTFQDVFNEVRRAINLAIGPTLARTYVTRSLIRQATEKQIGSKYVSVLILGATDEQEATAFQAAWPSRSTVIRLDGGTVISPSDVTALYNKTKKESA
jgi:hypothetical protein